MPALTAPVVLDVFCLLPYRSRSLRKGAPKEEDAWRNCEATWAFKNGRAMKGYGDASFAELLARMAKRCHASPLAEGASSTIWIPVPRSGESKPSREKNSDPYPCRTLASTLAYRLGGEAREVFKRIRPLDEEDKHKVQPGIDSMVMMLASAPTSRTVVLVDDVYTTGATLVSCAVLLRRLGYDGGIAAFCAGNDVARRDGHRVNPKRTQWRVTWIPGDERPESEFVGCWA